MTRGGIHLAGAGCLVVGHLADAAWYQHESVRRLRHVPPPRRCEEKISMSRSHRFRWFHLAGALAMVPAACLLAAPAVHAAPRAAAATSVSALPKIRHVWIIEEENESYGASFGNPSADPYLARTLVSKGALLK